MNGVVMKIKNENTGAMRTAWVPMTWVGQLTGEAERLRRGGIILRAEYGGRVFSTRPAGVECHIAETGLVRP